MSAGSRLPDPRRARPPVGIWQYLPSPAVSRYLGQMGWDWIILDLQHMSMSWETAYECVHVLRAAGASPFIRTAIGSPGEVERALDLGAHGVVVPMVNSVEAAKALARAAKYPPLGARSMGSDLACHYGAEYYDHANERTLLLVQAEHVDAIREIEAIVATPGVDGIFVGPTDLALSMGLGRTDHDDIPAHRDALARVVAACKEAGKLACCNTYSAADFQAKLDLGYGALTLRSEVDLFVDEGSRLLRELKSRTDQ